MTVYYVPNVIWGAGDIDQGRHELLMSGIWECVGWGERYKYKSALGEEKRVLVRTAGHSLQQDLCEGPLRKCHLCRAWSQRNVWAGKQWGENIPGKGVPWAKALPDDRTWLVWGTNRSAECAEKHRNTEVGRMWHKEKLEKSASFRAV